MDWMEADWSQISVRWPGRDHMGKGEGMGLEARGVVYLRI